MQGQDKLVCFIGPIGTSDYRAIALFPEAGEFQPLPMSSVSEIIQTVNFTPGCLGVLPIDNSTEGELTTVTDKLIFEAASVKVEAEAVLAERIGAFGVGGLDTATTVVSHPLILDLCSRFIRERGLEARHVLSTSEACRIVAADHDVTALALAPPVVAADWGLPLVLDSVADVSEIRTRYVLIGQGIPKPSGTDRTILIVTPSFDAVGSLAEVSSIFTRHRVNMLSILSRPLQAKLGFHTFYISCEGHIDDEDVLAAVAELLADGHSVKHLGSFPRWKGVDVTTPFASLPLGSIEGGSGDIEETRSFFCLMER